MNTPAGHRRPIASEVILFLLSVAYLGILFVTLNHLRDSSRTSVQEAALEVVRPVIDGVVTNGAPPAPQIWGLHTVRPLTAETAGNPFEREALALATSSRGTVHSSRQQRDARTVVEFAIADGRGGVAATEIEIRGGLASVEARFHQLYSIVVIAGLGVCVLFGVTALVCWRLRVARAQAVTPRVLDLERRMERFERAARASAHGHWELDYDSGRFWRSARFEELLGRAPRDAHDAIDDFERMPHVDDTDGVRSAFERHVETGVPFDVELRLQCADGEWRWFRYRASGEFMQGTMMRLCGSISEIGHERLAREESEGQRHTGQELDATGIDELLGNVRATGTDGT